MSELIFKDESYKIIGCCFEVYNDLSPRFLESVYQEALAMEFTEQGVPFIEFAEMKVFYKSKQLKVVSKNSFFRFGFNKKRITL